MNTDLQDEAEAHTLAKHRILEEYLKGWLPKLGRGQSNRLLYFDGFAGCGELAGKQPGSPVVAIRTALQAHQNAKVPFEIRMVEKNPDRWSHLCHIIELERQQVSQQIRIEDPICGECEEVVNKLLMDHQRSRARLGPALFFLDQYGYSGFSMDLVKRILSHEMCETFSYLNWQRMHPYLTDATKADTLTRALGGDEWRMVQQLHDQDRVEGFKSIYTGALTSRAKAKYVYDFAMRGSDHRLIYWLFFCTNSIDGLDVMKKAMWKVDPSGCFEFSDKYERQGFLHGYTQSMLAQELYRDLCGKELPADALKEHVLTKTPEYRYEEAIRILKESGKAAQHRRNGKTVYAFCEPPTATPGLFGSED